MTDYIKDIYGAECLEQAKDGKSFVSFGAILVKDKIIIGRGRNRRADSSDRLILSHVDYGIHAEQAAIVDAIKHGYNIIDAEVYVLGIVLSGNNRGQLSVRTKKAFGCKKCPHAFIKYGISVNIPLVDGWYKLSPQESMETGKEFSGKKNWKKFSEGLISL